MVAKRIYKNRRHVRWNWEVSPDNIGFLRFHFVIVDDKQREEKMNRILEHAQSLSIIKLPFREIRQSIEGKVSGTKFRYLFRSYDTQYNPHYLNPQFLFSYVKKDKDLHERKIGTIEEYVAGVYER